VVSHLWRFAIEKPYWAAEYEDVMAYDFNRELVLPGQVAKFPNGTIGIRVDNDFFVVAALPLSWRNIPLTVLVANLWPEIEDPDFGPDVIYSKNE